MCFIAGNDNGTRTDNEEQELSYKTIKAGLLNLLKTLELTESQEANDFKNASAEEYSNTFILMSNAGKMDEGPSGNSETLSSLFYDMQEWMIKVAFEKSKNDQVINRDVMLMKKDEIIAAIDNPSNWTSYARIQKYLSWEVEERDSYYILNVKVKIIDTITYS